MQWVVYRAFRLWMANWAVNSKDSESYLKAAFWFLVIGNILFYSRFVVSFTNLHSYEAIQWLLIKPGGIFFATIFLQFLVAAPYVVVRFVRAKVDKKEHRTPKPSSTKSETVDLSRRKFIKNAGTLAFGAPLVINTGFAVATHRNYVITDQTLLYTKLPSELEGLKIAHISDIHSGIFMSKNQIIEIFEIINAQNPDLVCITGDHVDTHVSEIPNIREAISALKPTYGIFGSPGNHDHYADIDAVVGAFADTRMNMLQNSNVELNIDGAPVNLIGIDDAGTGAMNFANPDKAFKGLNPESFKILMSHRPHLFDLAGEKDIHLTLAGHTHGGQIAIDLPGIELYPIDWFHKYSRGHYQQGESQLYVNVGVGLVGAPIRLVRPEITLLTLTSNPDKAGKTVRNA